MPHNEIADTIGRMKEVLLERGRAKVALENSDGEVCLLGAVCVAQGVPITTLTATQIYGALEVEPVVQFLAHRISPKPDVDAVPSIWVFNDNPHTTDQKVFDFLDEAQIAAKDL